MHTFEEGLDDFDIADIMLHKGDGPDTQGVLQICAGVSAPKKKSAGADFIIAQLVGALDLAIQHSSSDNVDKAAIGTLRSTLVTAHNWSRRQSPNQADRRLVIAGSLSQLLLSSSLKIQTNECLLCINDTNKTVVIRRRGTET